MEEIDVPPFFLCPISLEIMKDPVTVSTGITYDRQSIEKWVFSRKNNNCPVTKQVLVNSDLTPNHTLRRLIQSWCTLNSSHGVERFPTPKPPISKPQITKLINDSKLSPQLQMKCLKELKSIASASETNRRCIEDSVAVEFLASMIKNRGVEEVSEEGFELKTPIDEALNILYNLQLSESNLKSLIGENGEFIVSLSHLLQSPNYESRTYSILLLKSILEVANPMVLTNFKPNFFRQVLQVLRDQISQKASKAALEVLINASSWGRNRFRAIEAGSMRVLIDLLIDSSERRVCEMLLVGLELLCQCAEGRAELLSHGAGLAVVSKKVLRVSMVASERAVRVLYSIAKFSANPSVLYEMMQLGVVAKLGLVLQVDSGNKTKEKAREILKMHGRAWKNSPCMPKNLLSSYPS